MRCTTWARTTMKICNVCKAIQSQCKVNSEHREHQQLKYDRFA